jgi:Ca2+-binding EF-hand superfamily protein
MKKPKSAEEEMLKTMFDLFDDDSSGTITIEELRKLLQGVNCGVQKRRLERHFEFMDKDKSGEITFNEFVKATLGTAHPGAYTNYRDEKDGDAFGTDL